MKGFGVYFLFFFPLLPLDTAKEMKLHHSSFKVSTAPSFAGGLVWYYCVFLSLCFHQAAIACRSSPSGGLLSPTCDTHNTHPEVAEGRAMFFLAQGADNCSSWCRLSVALASCHPLGQENMFLTLSVKWYGWYSSCLENETLVSVQSVAPRVWFYSWVRMW